MDVVLVDEDDKQLGTMDKILVHEKGLLHRAFSVFVFNSENKLLMQRRSSGKYHSGGLWTNTCCSHPGAGADVKSAAQERLVAEMGFSCELKPLYNFVYRAEMNNGLIEHEYDHVFTGTFNGEPNINPEEVMEWKYCSIAFLLSDIETNPHLYTAWFSMALPRVTRELF